MVNQRTLSDLKKECSQLGITPIFPVAKNGKIKEGKRECVLALRDYYLYQRYPDKNIPKHLQIMLSIEAPMLCDRFAEKDSIMQKQIYESSEWGFQEKMNGARMEIIFVKGEGIHFYSRGVSVTDYLPVEYDNIYIGDVDVDKIGDVFNSFALDSEVISTSPNISTIMYKKGVVTETMLQAVSALLSLNKDDSLKIQKEENCPLKFFSFDCFYFDGNWFDEFNSQKPLIQVDREKVSKFITTYLFNIKMNIEHLVTVYEAESKTKFMSDIFERGGEGVVAKHKSALYRPVEARSRNLWVKIKRSVKQSLTSTPYGDTLDAYVVGFDLGEEGKGYEDLVGSLTFGVNLVKRDGKVVVHDIARISSIPLEMRKKITVVKDGKPVLIEEMYNKVAAIDGQSISSRARRLTHSRILEWRTDKNPDQCELTEEFLEKMIM